HPIDEYEKELRQFVRNRIVDLKADKNTQKIAGLVVGLRTMKNKRGDNMAFVVLDDRSGRIEISLFSEAYEQYREQITKDAILVVEGVVTFDDYSGMLKVRGKAVKTLLSARQDAVRSLDLSIEVSDFDDVGQQGFSDQIKCLLEPSLSGTCPVTINYHRGDARGCVRLGPQWQIQPSDDLIARLRERFGNDRVSLNYSR
ncbi:DNA polymerase III subunit alpha, partial [bacterium AH-315-K03]|nr:DNA polymerase III subunit alpha [bacterium AH-315-K03]